MEKVQFDIPFAKVDTSRRIVSGFATLDNVDEAKDVVTTEASMRAWNKFKGNVRELHAKSAVGRVLDFGLSQYFDKMSKKVYDGVFVRVYVSKGAPDTWEKVLDGTLTGFSIGGKVLDSETMIDDEGNPIRVVKDYELYELSLVDVPANPLATFQTIEKAQSFFTELAGDSEEKELENMAKDESDVVEDSAAVEEQPAAEEQPVVEDTAVVEDVPDETPEEDPKAQQPNDTLSSEPVENVQDSEKSERPTVSEPDMISAINEIKVLLEGNKSDVSAAFEALTSQLSELRTNITDAQGAVEEVKGDLALVKGKVENFDERVDLVEKDTAGRKSGDLGEVAQVKRTQTNRERSVWGGRFLTIDG